MHATASWSDAPGILFLGLGFYANLAGVAALRFRGSDPAFAARGARRVLLFAAAIASMLLFAIGMAFFGLMLAGHGLLFPLMTVAVFPLVIAVAVVTDLDQRLNAMSVWGVCKVYGLTVLGSAFGFIAVTVVTDLAGRWWP